MKFRAGTISISISDEAIRKGKSRDKFVDEFRVLFSGTGMEKERIDEILGNAYDSFHPKKAKEEK